MIEEFVKSLKGLESYKGQIENIEVIPSQQARYGKLDRPLPQVIQGYLDLRNISLFSHQAEAINKIRKGKNVVIATPTASGKTLAFNIPIFEAMMKDDKATALYLYPMKALANDQLQVLQSMEKETRIKVNPNVYDGDTPSSMRPHIRANSRIIVSNPYGIHQYLPWHYKWKAFFQNLKFIVIDEAHVYRGVFGSNMAFLIRRMLRICEYYGSKPQLILSSATIANPVEHSKKLTGREFEVVSDDGSERGRKFFIFWNPPFIDDASLVRRSTHQETRDIFVLSVTAKLQTLCFTVSRKMAELITVWSREVLGGRSPSLVNSVTSYRAGYLPSERRGIERALRNRDLLGVVSTNALELGIDIGSLDTVIISGYPGTVISTWQQAGRTGRTPNDSLVFLVAFSNPLDQYFMRHPKDFFGRSHEHAVIDLENQYITMGHLMCASSELPVTPKDQHYFPALESGLNALEKQGLVHNTPMGRVYAGRARPVEVVNLNNISDKTVSVINDDKILETMDLTKAYEEVYEGAVLLHLGETYLVEELDLKNLIAKVKQINLNYYTEPRKEIEIEIKKSLEEKDLGINLAFGEVDVTEFYLYYVKKTYDEIIGKGSMDLPPLKFSTIGMWFTVSAEIEEEIEGLGLDFQGGIHAIEHAMIAMAPFHAMCDRRDVGGVSTRYHLDTRKPTIFIYDGYEGGIGISEKLYELFAELTATTLKLIRDCECKEGCPSCIYSPKCGNENEPLDKKAAIIILGKLLEIIEHTELTKLKV